MGTPLTGKTPANTYDALIKVGDNSPLTSNLKVLSDGLGNDLPLTVSSTAITITGNATFSANVDATSAVLTVATQSANDNSTKAASTAYVDNSSGNADLDFGGDNASTGNVLLNTQTFQVSGTANEIVTAASNQSLTFSLDSSGVNLPNNSTAITQTAGDSSTKIATTAFVSSESLAQDLDFSGDTGTGAVILNTETFAVTGTTNQIQTTASGTGLALSLPSTVHRNLQGNVTGNLTGDVTGDLTGNVTATSVLVDGVIGTTQAVADDSTKVATTAFVQDVVGTIPAGLVFQGTWNASTNTPTLASGTGTTGHFYIVSVAGTTNLDGVTDWAVGDWAVFVEQGASDQWEKVDNSSVLDGNGTGGKISKWAGSGNSVTLTDSVITEDSSNIGIGDATPTSKLSVVGTGSSFTTGDGTRAFRVFTDSDEVSLLADGTVDMKFYTSGSEKMRITTAGAIKLSNYGAGTLVSDASGNITSISGGGEGGPYLPLAGGTMTGNTDHNDSVESRFGNSGDFIIKHTGSTYLSNTSGNLYFRGQTTDGDIIFQNDNGSGGIDTYFYLDGSLVNGSSILGATRFPDKSQIFLGTGGDMALYHDGTNSFISNGTGDITIENSSNDSDIIFRSDDGSGGTTEYFKLDGSQTIIDVATRTLFRDSVKATFGAGYDLEIYHDGSNSYINDTGTGSLITQTSAYFLRQGGTNNTNNAIVANTSVDLYYDNSKKFETTSQGISVSGDVSSGDITIAVDDTPTLNFKKASSADVLGIINVTTDAGSGGKMVFQTKRNGNTPLDALTIDDGQNATFAGEVEVINANGLITGRSSSSSNTNSSLRFMGGAYTGNKATAILYDGVNGENQLYLGGGTGLGEPATSIRFNTGSAGATGAGTERMRIDSAGNVGIGTTAPSAKINIANSTNQNGGTIENSSASFDQTGLLVNNTSSTSGELFRLRSSGSNKFIVSGSGNVGINDTSSGSVASNYSPKLLVGGSIVARSLTSSASMISIGGDATSAFISAGKQDGSLTSRPLRIEVGSTEAMRISNAGDVGINETSPSAISANATTLTIKGKSTTKAGALLLKSSDNSVSAYMWPDSVNGLTVGTLSNHNFRFLTNSAERMRIESGGNVGIGTTSPSVKLAVEENVNSSASILVNNPNTGTGARANLILTSDSARIDMYATSAAYNGVASWADAGVINTSSATSGGLILNSQSGGIKFQYGTAEKMRIDSSGKLLVGKTSSNYATEGVEIRPDEVLITKDAGTVLSLNRLTSDGSIIVLTKDSSTIGSIGSNTTGGQPLLDIAGATGNSNIRFLTTNTERMRIDSAGNFLIGTTGVPNGTSVYGSAFINDTDSANVLKMASSKSTAKTLIQFLNPNGSVGSIQTNGSATAYNTSSDYRLKENVVEMTGALDRVAQLKPSRFNFIADSDTTVDGFLAHEVQSIVPEAITGTKDGMKDEEYEKTPAVYEDKVHPAIEEEKDEEGNVITEAKESWTEKVLVSEAVMDTRSVPDYQGIDQSKLVPLLVGAIQELKAEIELLKAK